MKKVFIKVVNGNHQECIDYLVSIGGNNPYRRLAEDADSYCINELRSIEWMYDYKWFVNNGYTEIFLPEASPSKRHPHYDLIVQWASDPTQKVWKSHNGSAWTLCDTPKWIAEDKYYVGETPPPSLEPVLFKDVCKGVVYYVAAISRPLLHFRQRSFDESEKYLFDRKLVYSTPEGAIKRAKEMLGMAD